VTSLKKGTRSNYKSLNNYVKFAKSIGIQIDEDDAGTRREEN